MQWLRAMTGQWVPLSTVCKFQPVGDLEGYWVEFETPDAVYCWQDGFKTIQEAQTWLDDKMKG